MLTVTFGRSVRWSVVPLAHRKRTLLAGPAACDDPLMNDWFVVAVAAVILVVTLAALAVDWWRERRAGD